VIIGLCRLEAASSRKPLDEGCPPDACRQQPVWLCALRAKKVQVLTDEHNGG